MRTVVVDHQNATLSHDAGALCIRAADVTLQRVPLAQMDRLIVENEALLSVNLVRQLAAHDIALVITRGRSRASAALLWPAAGDARRRLQQAMAWLSPEVRLGYARRVVRGRVLSQAVLLRRWATRSPEHRYRFLGAARALARLSKRLVSATSVETLRGLEGVAARLFFGAYRQILPPSLGFPGRRRRPPTDPVNAALSLGFTLLHGRALEAVHRAGLDPSLGALHDLAHGRPSLVCDLVEWERHVVEACVENLFRTRALEAHHFGRTLDACHLLKSGRGAFFAAMEPVLVRAERRITRRLYRLIRSLPELPAK